MDERQRLLRHAADVLVSLADTLDFPDGSFQYTDNSATDEDGHLIDGGSVGNANREFLYRLANAALKAAS